MDLNELLLLVESPEEDLYPEKTFEKVRIVFGEENVPKNVMLGLTLWCCRISTGNFTPRMKNDALKLLSESANVCCDFTCEVLSSMWKNLSTKSDEQILCLGGIIADSSSTCSNESLKDLQCEMTKCISEKFNVEESRRLLSLCLPVLKAVGNSSLLEMNFAVSFAGLLACAELSLKERNIFVLSIEKRLNLFSSVYEQCKLSNCENCWLLCCFVGVVESLQHPQCATVWKDSLSILLRLLDKPHHEFWILGVRLLHHFGNEISRTELKWFDELVLDAIFRVFRSFGAAVDIVPSGARQMLINTMGEIALLLCDTSSEGKLHEIFSEYCRMNLLLESLPIIQKLGVFASKYLRICLPVVLEGIKNEDLGESWKSVRLLGKLLKNCWPRLRYQAQGIVESLTHELERVGSLPPSRRTAKTVSAEIWEEEVSNLIDTLNTISCTNMSD